MFQEMKATAHGTMKIGGKTKQPLNIEEGEAMEDMSAVEKTEVEEGADIKP